MEDDLRLTPGRVPSFIGKPGAGGYKIYLTSADGRLWVEFGGGGVVENPLGMAKQPNRGFETEEDAWQFADSILGSFPGVVDAPRAVFRLYSYAHKAEFYLGRSRPLQKNAAITGSAPELAALFDGSRDVKTYERASRPNQAEFRAAVLGRYGSRCAFCRISADELLDAAHVIAWSENGADVPENGLVLCKLHHRALDAGLIRIHPESFELRGVRGDLAELHVEAADLRHLPARPHRDALQWLWQRLEP